MTENLTVGQEVRVRTLHGSMSGTVTYIGRRWATIRYGTRQDDFDMETRRRKGRQVGTGTYYELPGSDPAVREPKSDVDEHEYAWTVEGESYHPHSSQEWQPEEASGTIRAEGAGEALERIVRGVGFPLNDTIPWDIIDQDREIIITIRPVDNSPGES